MGVLLDLINHLFLNQKTIYIPQPTWGNHTKIFGLAGLSVKTYRYYDPATRGLDFKGMKRIVVFVMTYLYMAFI